MQEKSVFGLAASFVRSHKSVGLAVLLCAIAGAGFAACTQSNEEGEENEEAVGGCGVERWDVKTGIDPAASQINFTPVDTTIPALTSVPAPKTLTTRVAPQETTIFHLTNVTLTELKSESDSDYHLVISDGKNTMIAEIPAPSCVKGGPFLSGVTASRAAVDAKFKVSGSVQTPNIPISLIGAGFFDFKHGQNGVAPNAFELHSVLQICFGQDCTLTGVDGGGVPDSGGGQEGGTCEAGAGPSPIKTAFVILMENHNWSSINGSSSAPFINNTLLPMASHAVNYNNVPGLHPSLPNYLWLEAGNNFGVTADGDPSKFPQSTTAHLVNQLEAAGVNWKEYAENTTGSSCPLTTSGLYAPKHVPFVYFDDVMNNASRCTTHVRPYTELAGDLSSGNVSGYNFITPNLCDDMHNSSGCTTSDSIANGDKWLSTEVPKILASSAFKNNGALFITWDESEGGNVPIGMIVLSPLAKGGGYTGSVAYSHSSTLRTMQEIFGVGPFLADAANATDLADLFQPGALGGAGGTCSTDAGTDSGGGGNDAAADTGGGNDAAADTGGGNDAAPDTGGGNTCAHPLCTVGTKLVATCDPCAGQVCAKDSFCCRTSWDNQCVGEVTSVCGQTCP